MNVFSYTYNMSSWKSLLIIKLNQSIILSIYITTDEVYSSVNIADIYNNYILINEVCYIMT